MATVSDSRLKEVVGYEKEYGVEKTLESFPKLSIQSIERYKREAYSRGIYSKPYNDPRVLLFDIETAPCLAEIWDTGKQYISHDQIVKGRSILTWSAKWLCDDEIIKAKVNTTQAKHRKDKNIIVRLHKLINEADILIAHNGKSFDKKIFNARALMNDLLPPSPYRIIDTYRQSKKEFKFISHSLNYIGQQLVNNKKIDTSRELWHRCVNGDDKALQEMLDYNVQDIRLLEDVFFKLRGWMTGAPNMSMYYDNMENRCPRCGSDNLKKSTGYYFTTANRYKARQCKDCGCWGRSPHSDLTAEDKKELLRPVARYG